jgi:arginine/lysine/ornithine decarboxylase
MKILIARFHRWIYLCTLGMWRGERATETYVYAPEHTLVVLGVAKGQALSSDPATWNDRKVFYNRPFKWNEEKQMFELDKLP